MGIAAFAIAACVGASGVEIEPRYAAVRSTFVAMGMAPIGEAQRGVLARGADARVPITLEAACTTIVAVGGEGVRDIEISLLDPSGRSIARAGTREPQATLRACVDVAGAYTIVVHVVEGAGSYVASAWSGGTGGNAPAPSTSASSAPDVHATGTCDAPFPLVSGSVAGNTARGSSEHQGSCGRNVAKELVYQLRVATRTHLRATVHAQFDSVLYLRKGSCDDGTGEIACNDDAPGGNGSAVDAFLDAGVYFLFVDGLGKDEGPFRLAVELKDVPPVAEICRHARPLAFGASVSGTTVGAFDNANATCGEGAPGLDVPFKLDVTRRSRVRVVERSDDVRPVVHVRRVCADEASEVACSARGVVPEEAAFVGVLEAGSYAVFADATARDVAGRYTLRAETAPEQGSGVAGDGCSDAAPLSAPDKPAGDTFLARDDVAGSCGGSGAPDVVYRVDIPRRTRFAAQIDGEEGRHVLVLSRACGDKSAEIACAARIDEALAPGVYFLAVDGATAGSFGRFTLDVRARDIGAQESACKNPTTLVAGKTLSASTASAGDKFTTTCGGREDAPGTSDRVYRVVLAQKSRVQILLATPTWDGVVALRRSCVDLAASPRSSELRCNNDSGDSHHSKIDMTLDPGTYFVVVDGHSAGDEGAFTLEYKLGP